LSWFLPHDEEFLLIDKCKAIDMGDIQLDGLGGLQRLWRGRLVVLFFSRARSKRRAAARISE